MPKIKKIIFKPAFRVEKISSAELQAVHRKKPPGSVFSKKTIPKIRPELFFKTKKFEERIQTAGNVLNKKNDTIYFSALFVIFAVIFFLGLTLLSHGFSFTLQIFSNRI